MKRLFEGFFDNFEAKCGIGLFCIIFIALLIGLWQLDMWIPIGIVVVMIGAPFVGHVLSKIG